ETGYARLAYGSAAPFRSLWRIPRFCPLSPIGNCPPSVEGMQASSHSQLRSCSHASSAALQLTLPYAEARSQLRLESNFHRLQLKTGYPSGWKVPLDHSPLLFSHS